MTNHTREVRGLPTIDAPPLQAPGGDYDALAELFLGEGPATTTVPAAESTPDPALTRRIEGLIIGHLPVLAAAWVTQYAKHLAEQEKRPIGLLRVRAGQVSIEAILPTAGPSIAPTAGAPFEAAVAEAARLTAVWVVRVDELTEPRLAEIPGIDALTLLTGADEAAVVASYRTIKRMTEQPGEGEMVPFGIAVMGSTAERARQAAERLSRTASIHVGRPVGLTACVPQIGPGRSVTLYRADSTEPGETIVTRAIEIIRASGPAAQPIPAAPAAPVRAPTHETPADHASRNGGCRVRLVTTPDPEWDGAPAEPATAPDLIAHVPGLTALPPGAASPFTPEIRVAFDSGGVLHLLAWAGDGETAAVQRLLEASAWASAHDALLRLAADRTAPTAATPPTLHLFTPDARAVRRLLDAPLRVHVLSPVPAGAAWVAADLN